MSQSNTNAFMDSKIAKLLSEVKSGKVTEEEITESCWYYLHKMFLSQKDMAEEQSEDNYKKYALNCTLYTIYMETINKLLSC